MSNNLNDLENSSDTMKLLSRSDEARQRRYSEEELLDDSETPSDNSKSGSFGAIFNMIKSIIGSGMLGSPHAMVQCGIGLGSLMLIGVGVVSDYSLRILMKAALAADAQTYQGVATKAFGTLGYIAVTIMQFLFPFLAMISYNIIIGDTVTKVISRLGGDAIDGTILTNRMFVIIFSSICITMPLSMYKNIAKYAKFSGASLFVVLFSVIFVFIKLASYTKDGVVPSQPDDWSFAHVQFAGGVSILATAYICHHNSFLVFDSMKERTEQAWSLVVHCSLAVVVAVMLLFSIGAYATFKGFTEGDIFENYCSYDDFANVARAIYGVNILLTYPIQCFVVRELIENTFWFNDKDNSLPRHIILTLAICLSTDAIAMATGCVSIVLQLNGVVSSIPLIFIMPALCYIKHCGETPWHSWANMPAILTVVAGFLLCILGIYEVVMHFVRGVGCSEGHDLSYCFRNVTNSTVPINSTLFLTL